MAAPDIAHFQSLPTRAVRTRARRDLLELSVGYVLILIVLWTPRALQRPFYLAAVAWVVAVTWHSFTSGRAMGLRLTNLLRSLWIVPLALLAAASAILVARHLGTLHVPPTPSLFVKTFWGYAIWSLAQQFLLQNFFLQRLLRMLPSPRAAVLTASGLFALAHLPNPILTLVTLVWGAIACVLFLRYRNLYPLGVAHAILGITMAIAFPGPVLHNMRVGLGYLTYRPHRPDHPTQPVRATPPAANTLPPRLHA